MEDLQEDHSHIKTQACREDLDKNDNFEFR